MEDLTDRQARCHCKRIVPSSYDLAFFEYRGEGSKVATETCKCGYALIAHTQKIVRSPQGSIVIHNVVEEGTCPGFEPRGPMEYDLYYCGCGGWD